MTIRGEGNAIISTVLVHNGAGSLRHAIGKLAFFIYTMSTSRQQRKQKNSRTHEAAGCPAQGAL